MKKHEIILAVAKSFDPSYKNYISACEELGIQYREIDIFAPDWIDRVKNCGCDGILLRPPCDLQERKTIFDERMYYINKVMGIPTYPEFDELYIYENKRNMAAWLELHGYPHAKTSVFVRKSDALDYLQSCEYPIVIKSNIGYGAKRVLIVKSRREAKKIARKTFGYFHHAIALGWYPFSTFKKLTLPIPHFGKAQKHFLIVQDFKKIVWEWRIIKIGNSYFGHKKLLKGEFASGSKLVGWERPPEKLLHMVRELTEKGGFRSMAMDVFETAEGEYYINELQSLFGSYINSQMYIDGTPGRFVYNNEKFEFEEGEFNRHGSYLLRVQHFLEILEADRAE